MMQKSCSNVVVRELSVQCVDQAINTHSKRLSSGEALGEGVVKSKKEKRKGFPSFKKGEETGENEGLISFRWSVIFF